MKKHTSNYRLSVTAALLIIHLLLISGASAALVIQVDTLTQTYWLTGQAIGEPDEWDSGLGEIFWNSSQPSGGGYENFLQQASFISNGNTITGFNMYIHANGNVNGVLYLQSTATVTLSGNEGAVLSYAEWNPLVAQSLENLAANNAEIGLISGFSGSPSFAMTVAQVPEPSTGALVGVFALLAISSHRTRRRSQHLPRRELNRHDHSTFYPQ